MPTMRTYTCTHCGASLATNAPPGTTIICEYCSTPFEVPPPSLDQPGDSQATVVANFRPRGNPSSIPPTGPDGEPPSTPEQPPAPDSPAGVGYTVDADAVQPMVGRDELAAAPVDSEAEVLPEPPPAPDVELEPGPREPEIIEELPAPETVDEPVYDAEPEPEPEVPPVVVEPAPRETLDVTPGVSAADIIAEPTKYGAAIPAEQGEPILVPPNRVEVVPPQNPVAGGPPGAAMRRNNRTPLVIGGAVVLLCCLLATCALLLSLVLPLLNTGGGI